MFTPPGIRCSHCKVGKFCCDLEACNFKTVTTVCSSKGTTRMYTMVMAMVFHGRNPMNKTHHPSQSQPNSANKATYSTLQPRNSVHHLRHVYAGQSHYLSCKTKTENWNPFNMITERAFFEWSRKGAFTSVDLNQMTPYEDVINRQAFWFNLRTKALLSFDLIIAARLNRLCKHLYSQLF
jgi:hypothetical protein